MKKKKAKLFYIVVSMALSMSFFLIGVYSAATRTASVTGSLSFNASYVWVNYKVQISDPYVTNPVTWRSPIADSNFNENQASKEVNVENGSMNISDATPKIAFRITFSKLSGFSRNYYIKVTDLPSPSGPIASVQTNNNGYQSATGLSTAAFGDSIELIFYFTAVENHSFASEQNFSFNIKIDLSLVAFS